MTRMTNKYLVQTIIGALVFGDKTFRSKKAAIKAAKKQHKELAGLNPDEISFTIVSREDEDEDTVDVIGL